MKIRATQDFLYGNDEVREGEVRELPNSDAKEAIEKELAVEVNQEGRTIWEEMERKLDEEPPEQTGGWLTADDVDEGDEIVIQGPGGWNDQFVQDRDNEPDLVLPVELNGVPHQWRLNKTQMRKFANAWGNNTSGWVGEKAIVVEPDVEYKNLGVTGFKVAVSE